MKIYLKKIRGNWHLASGAIGFPTTVEQHDCFSRYISGDSAELTVTTDRTDLSLIKIVPKDTGRDYLCEMRDANSNELVGTVNICYHYFEKLHIDGEFYFNRVEENGDRGE